MNGWCSQRDCVLMEAKIQYMFYGTLRETENKKKKEKAPKLGPREYNIMWSKLDMPTCKCSNFYVIWIIHNCSYSLYNSKQNQLYMLFVVHL